MRQTLQHFPTKLVEKNDYTSDSTYMFPRQVCFMIYWFYDIKNLVITGNLKFQDIYIEEILIRLGEVNWLKTLKEE